MSKKIEIEIPEGKVAEADGLSPKKLVRKINKKIL